MICIVNKNNSVIYNNSDKTLSRYIAIFYEKNASIMKNSFAFFLKSSYTLDIGAGTNPALI